MESLKKYQKQIPLVVLAVLGVVLLSIGYPGSSMPDNPGPEGAAVPQAPGAAPPGESGVTELGALEQALEIRLEQTLEEIEGAGEVKVTITLTSSPETIYAINERSSDKRIEEQDQNGGTRVTTEQTAEGQVATVQDGSSGRETALVVKQNQPSINGVLVVAEGAADPLIRERLTLAVETVLGVKPHQVAVQEKRGK